MSKPEGIKIVADNRRARHQYLFLERIEAGIVLTGTEVKAIKSGKVQLVDAYAAVQNNELWLINAHISHYSFGNVHNHDPVQRRKLLVHRKEISRLQVQSREKGLTLVPTKMYLKDGRVKIEIAVARGKKIYDKRETERKREADKEARQAIRDRHGR